jgi:SET domain-containing protein
MVHNTLLACRPASGGLGVFARRAIRPGQRLLEFTGPMMGRKALDAALDRAPVDSFLQMAADRYMGPSGGFDDFVNHACDPNCGLRFSGSKIVLTAIHPIAPDEQITFDYATTQNGYPCRFLCGCGSHLCRHDIGDFDDLPDTLKWRYHRRGILAPYLTARLTGNVGLRLVASMSS